MTGEHDWEDYDERTVVGQVPGAVKPTARGDEAYVIVIAGPNVGEMFKIGDGAFIGRGTESAIRLTDTEISRKHAHLRIIAGKVVVEDLGSTNGTFVNGVPVDRLALKDGDKIQVGTTTILKFSYHDDLEEQFQRQMYESALRDGLTGAFNKKYFLERLEAEVAFAARHGSPLSLLLFDLDHFKRINDTYGHLAGDYVLTTLSKFVATTIRQEDVFARYGGEEFTVLSRGIASLGAAQFAERMREGIDQYDFIYEGQKMPVTISVGIASIPQPPINTPHLLVDAADKALYVAKEAGRNRIQIYAVAPK